MLQNRVITAFAALFIVGEAGAQVDLPADDTTTARESGWVRTWVPLGSAAEDRFRLAHLVEARPERGAYLLRSASSLLARPEGPASVALLIPRADLIWNSTLPHSLNDGAAWAGKGVTSRLVVGIEAAAGPVRLIVAPELVSEQNAAFDALLPEAWDDEQRGRFTAPWSIGEHSVDLPYRPGDESRTTVFAGESSLTLRAGVVEAGIATESQWWGPGTRNAILLSDNAGGFPHALVRFARPVATPIGHVSGRLIAGRLSASPFDTVGAGSRTLSGAAVTVSPMDGLALGVGRIVYLRGRDLDAGDALGVFTRWRNAGDTLTGHPYEQMISFFGRWVLPVERAEVYGEWARRRLPASFRDLLEQPEHTQAYTLGAQWARPHRGGALRLQTEVSYLEKSATYRARPTGSWYAGRAVPQGYTHRGQPLGAAIGPGASAQWLAVDHLARTWSAGLSVNRIRWANDAYYDKPDGHNRYRAHDVTFVGAARAGVAIGPVWLDARWTAGRRNNFFFQNTTLDFYNQFSVSPSNHTLQLGFSPRAR